MDHDDEAYEGVSRAAGAGLSFFGMVTVDLGDGLCTVSFGKSYVDEEVPVQQATIMKQFVKETRRWLRAHADKETTEDGRSVASIVRRKIFWFVTECIQEGIFTVMQQGKIMTYATFCFHETKD